MVSEETTEFVVRGHHGVLGVIVPRLVELVFNHRPVNAFNHGNN